jgi:hypothetical protein
MSFISNLSRQPGHAVSKLWLFLWELTTNRFKRMCLLASLHAQLVRCNEKDHDQLEDVNNELDLDRNPRALMFPTLFAPVIWRSVLPIDKIDMDRSDVYIARLIKKTPCWLLYADLQTVHNDIHSLLLYCRERRNAT